MWVFHRNPTCSLYRIRHFPTFQCTGKHYKNNKFNFKFNYTLTFYVTSGNVVSFSLWPKKKKKTEGKMDGQKKKPMNKSCHSEWWKIIYVTDHSGSMSGSCAFKYTFFKIYFFLVTEVLDIVHIFKLKKATKFRKLHLLPCAGRIGNGETVLCCNRWKELVLMNGNKTQYRFSIRWQAM